MICRRMPRCKFNLMQPSESPASRYRIDAMCRCRASGLLLVFELCLLSAGCNRGPAAVKPPYIDPVAASRQAIELYDTDHDGELSDQELAACPGILQHRDLYDLDHNGKVSRQEVEDRIRKLRSSRIGLTKLAVQVRLDGRPLVGADVKLIPEKYLGDDIKAAVGKTGGSGLAVMHIPDQDLPSSQHGLIGVHYGTYKVEITHPTVKIPPKYNTQTTLGYETERGNPSADFDLKSK
jgi:EF hand